MKSAIQKWGIQYTGSINVRMQKMQTTMATTPLQNLEHNPL